MSKYLNNYLLWNILLNVKEGSLNDKVINLLRKVATTFTTIKSRSLSSRPVIPLPIG